MNVDRPRLSTEARRWLVQRLTELEDERIPRLEREFATEPDALSERALHDARNEAARLRDALATATPLEDEPHDPTIVELGDSVMIRPEAGGERVRYTLVGELEARMDETRISERAPLGSALLGSSIGQVVAVEAPGGVERYEVLAIERNG